MTPSPSRKFRPARRVAFGRLFIVAALVAAIAWGFSLLADAHGPLVAFAAFLALNAACMPAASTTLGAITTLDDLFVPEVVLPSVAQKSKLGNNIIGSPIMARSPKLDEVLGGGGSVLTIPSYAPMRAASRPQKRSTALGVNNVSQQLQKAPRLQREVAFGAEAIARAMGHSDPVGAITSGVADNRTYDRQGILLAMIRGIFGSKGASGGAGAYSALRKDSFDESGNDASAAQLIDSDLLADTINLMGEMKTLLENGGGILCHSDIENALNKQDSIETIKGSDGKIVLRLWRGKPLFLSDLLRRAGTTNGYVYDTYVFAPGIVATGDKPQSMNIGDTASLVLDGDANLNNITIYDRTDFYLHLNGSKWIGDPVDDTPSNTELETVANWEAGITDIQTVGAVCLRTNG